ncbi:MAG: peptidase T [Lachnospiraceae bacterium]|nr:peptidase T [Lachnospiraceae bacterium]
MSEVLERFLRYVKIDTRSSEESGLSPSTEKQHDLAKLLYEELQELGASDVFYDKEHCYVYAKIPANNADKMPEGTRPISLGFVSHMDTSPEVTGTNVSPRIVKEYDGGDIVLNGEAQILLSPKDFPHLSAQKGKDLVVTDGKTLLGADDKAGVAEIMTMAKTLLSDDTLPHGDIRICFTPDEEIGEGVKFFDLERFSADCAYTVDGGGLGELEYENFNAAEAEVTFYGRSVHPGSAKGQMINATLLAYEFHQLLPEFQNPMYTEGREGFYHLNQMRGTVEKAVVHYILRDHDREKFEEKKEMMRRVTDFLNAKYGEGRVELNMADVYYNMIEKILPHMHLIETAREAMQAEGVTPIETPIRGGTDGAMLSYKGLPCPNLCTGGYNYHGRFEYASIPEMESTVKILLGIVDRYAAFHVAADGQISKA